MSNVINNTPTAPILGNQENGVKRFIIMIVLVVIAIGIISNYSKIEDFFIKLIVEEGLIDIKDDDDDSPAYDVKYIEAYLSNTYNDVCWSLDNETYYACKKIGNNSVYARPEDDEEGGIVVKDGYYYAKYHDWIEDFFTSIAQTNVDTKADVELTTRSDIVTSDLELSNDSTVNDFLNVFEEKMIFTLRVSDKSVLSQQKINAMTALAAKMFHVFQIKIYEGEDTEELLEIDCKNGYAEMSYYEFD